MAISGATNLRKLIDYFCHLFVAPHVFSDIGRERHQLRVIRIPPGHLLAEERQL